MPDSLLAVTLSLKRFATQVRPVNGSDLDVEHLIGLWHNTLREDRWLGENNHHGILSSRYAYKGGQPYMATEGGPGRFVKWYLSEVVPHEAQKQTTAG